ncbi:MAG: hypothetical protein AAGJ80_19445, partial [Cyanobacteria bacterium J06553_1]
MVKTVRITCIATTLLIAGCLNNAPPLATYNPKNIDKIEVYESFGDTDILISSIQSNEEITKALGLINEYNINCCGYALGGSNAILPYWL